MDFSKELLKVGLIQPHLLWEDPEGNLGLMEKMMEDLPRETALIILPETFSTGFTMRADRFAEEKGGMAHAWLLKVARERNAYVTGSLIVRDQDRIFNRLYWVSPEGIEGYYDKRHLFRMGREHAHFHPGDARKVFTLGPFRFMPQICYDLRFPVFARSRDDYDVLLYVANWPAPRQHVWETLLRARAIENQACVIGVSRVGVDGEGVDHLGGSCVIDPMGRTEELLDNRPGIINYTIDLNKIREFREKFPAWKDSDMFSLE